MRAAIVLLLALCLGACATYREDLNRGQRFYEENELEHALAIFRVLETDMDSLSFNDQARYAYLRGMTDYRLGTEFRADARHWLALARAIEQEHPGGLSEKWKQLLDEALADLNREVYAHPYAASEVAPAGKFAGEGAGEAEAPEPAAEAAPDEAPKKKKQPKQAGECSSSADCAEGSSCQAGECVIL
jgi:hypothetical protein